MGDEQVKRRAELVFVESPRGGRWRGHLLNGIDAVDERTGKRNPRYTARITETEDGFETLTQGEHVGSRRRYWYPTLTEAQAAMMRWAKRRFYMVGAA